MKDGDNLENLSISETLVVAFDLSKDDEAILSVAQHSGGKINIIKTLKNEYAKNIYGLLTNKTV